MKIIILLFLFLPLFIHAQDVNRCYLPDTNAGPRDHNVDFTHLLLYVSFVPEDGKVIGTVTHTFSPLQQKVDSVFLDAPDIHFNSVKLNDADVKYTTNDKGITVWFDPPLEWNKNYSLKIDYDCTPRKGIYFIGWNEEEPDKRTDQYQTRNQIWTQGQGIDNRYWIPMYDDMNDKIISEVYVTAESKYRVLSNGEFIETTVAENDQTVWHYRMTYPQPPYLIMLGIGEYGVSSSKSLSGVPMNFYYYSDEPQKEKSTYQFSEKMMDFLEKEFGVAYPWESYSQIPVQDFMYGAMENTTATVFTDFYVKDKRANLDRDYIGTNAHELVHQWFGDFVTAWGGEGTWLQESFATHYAKEFRKSIFGKDEYDWDRWGEMQASLAASKTDLYPVVHTKAGGSRVYQKGSVVLDMLRYILGNDQYRKAVTYYLQQHPYTNVDTHDFQMSFFESLGINLDWFFDQWLYRGGEPHYELSYIAEEFNHLPAILITVKQIQEQKECVGLFRMPVVFEIHYDDGAVDSKTEWIEKAEQQVVFMNPDNKLVSFILFDPDKKNLCNVTFVRSYDELEAQVFGAKNMLDKMDALIAMRDLEPKQKRNTMNWIYDQNSFYAIRNEIINQLMNADAKKNEAMILKAVNDKSSRVRLNLINGIEEIDEDWLPEFERLLVDSSYGVIESALVKLSTQFPKKKNDYLATSKDVEGYNMNVKIRWLEIASADSVKHFDMLVEYSGAGYEFRTRINAMNALERLEYYNDFNFVNNLLNALMSGNSRLAGPAKNLLKKINADNPYLIIEAVNGRGWESWERERIDRVLEVTQ